MLLPSDLKQIKRFLSKAPDQWTLFFDTTIGTINPSSLMWLMNQMKWNPGNDKASFCMGKVKRNSESFIKPRLKLKLQICLSEVVCVWQSKRVCGNQTRETIKTRHYVFQNCDRSPWMVNTFGFKLIGGRSQEEKINTNKWCKENVEIHSTKLWVNFVYLCNSRFIWKWEEMQQMFFFL